MVQWPLIKFPEPRFPLSRSSVEDPLSHWPHYRIMWATIRMLIVDVIACPTIVPTRVGMFSHVLNIEIHFWTDPILKVELFSNQGFLFCQMHFFYAWLIFSPWCNMSLSIFQVFFLSNTLCKNEQIIHGYIRCTSIYSMYLVWQTGELGLVC